MNPYTTLGVDKTATAADIKAAYRKLARQHHPDKGGDPEVFGPIADAWACLSDPEKRVEYDETGVMNFDLNAAIQAEAVTVVAKMVGDTLDQMVKANMVRHPGDFVEAMKKFIREKMGENQVDLDKTKIADRLYQDTLEKIYIKNPEEFEEGDVIAGVVKKKQEENDFKQFAIGNSLKVLTKCLELLDLYGCNVPEQLTAPGPSLVFTINGLTGGWSRT